MFSDSTVDLELTSISLNYTVWKCSVNQNQAILKGLAFLSPVLQLRGGERRRSPLFPIPSSCCFGSNGHRKRGERWPVYISLFDIVALVRILSRLSAWIRFSRESSLMSVFYYAFIKSPPGFRTTSTTRKAKRGKVNSKSARTERSSSSCCRASANL
jgi:hypothetical protein